MLFKDLHNYLSTIALIWCYNIGSIALASNLVFHARTKHLDLIIIIFMRKVVRKELDVRCSNIVDQLVGILTKGLTSAYFQMLRFKLVIHPRLACLLGSNGDKDKDGKNAPTLASILAQS